MQGCRTLSLALLLAAFAAPPAEASKDVENPLARVLALLDSLTAKITKEGEVEAKAYKEFVQWCDDASRNKNFAIETATKEQAKLEATIGKASGDAEAAAAEVERLSASIATNEGDLKSATDIRTKEAADFASDEAELMETIDTLKRAIAIVGREMAKSSSAFTQVDASNIANLVKSLGAVVDAAGFAGADKDRLLALVQSEQSAKNDDGLTGAPAGAVYKSQSGDIMDVLEDLKEKAEEQLSSLRKAETSAKHNFAMLKQSLEDQMSADTKSLSEEQTSKATSLSTKATSESALAETIKDLTDGKAALESANANCMQTAADHEATVTARTEELSVIAKAKEILSSSTPGAVAQTYSMLQVGGTSRLRARADLANAEVVAMVKQLAQKHHSAALTQLASRIAAVLRYGVASGEDPFKKVKGLISDLIVRLESEASADATEKAYCDEQMADTLAKKTELEEDLAKLTAKIEQAKARTATLEGEVKDLQEELANLAKEQAEMDAVRSESHADYVQAKADLEAGLEGVRQALGVLRDYYGGASAAAMMQLGDAQPEVPKHAAATGAGTSIIGILEVVESDFAKDLTMEEVAESDAAAEYEKTTQANSVTKTLKDQDVKYKELEISQLAKDLSTLGADSTSTNTQLAAVMDYDEKIKARCVAKPETYETRKARREAEIAGLKQALAVLEDETAFVQRKQRGLRQNVLSAQ